MTHMTVERKGKDVTVKCGKVVRPEDATVWSSMVKCEECLAKMGVGLGSGASALP